MQASWPKNGVVIVFCKGGKYWAGSVSPGLENAQSVLEDLQKQAAVQLGKELVKLCGKQVSRKLVPIH